MTTYILQGPTVEETPAAWDRFHCRIRLTRGITIVERMDGSFYETRFPAQTDLEAAANYWLGGHIYELSAPDAAALTAAGYGAYITTIP